MIFSKRILILEDNLITLSKLLAELALVEADQSYELSLVILTDHTQVLDYLNDNPKADFDIILLDRDCKLGGSFHTLDLERFGPEKVISISSIPEYNEEARKRGVTKTILKDFGQLNTFAKEVAGVVRGMLNKMPLVDPDQIT